MLKERRTKHVEYRAVRLDNMEETLQVPDGSMLVPVGVEGGDLLWGIPETLNTADAATGMARVVFSEPGRFDTMETNKTVVLEGAIEIETDMFIAADEGVMAFGTPLTAKKDADGVIKFGHAAATDQVVARVVIAPSAHAEGLLALSGVFK